MGQHLLMLGISSASLMSFDVFIIFDNQSAAGTNTQSSDRSSLSIPTEHSPQQRDRTHTHLIEVARPYQGEACNIVKLMAYACPSDIFMKLNLSKTEELHQSTLLSYYVSTITSLMNIQIPFRRLLIYVVEFSAQSRQIMKCNYQNIAQVNIKATHLIQPHKSTACHIDKRHTDIFNNAPNT